MRLPGPVEKPAAAGARRQPAGNDLVQARPAEDPLAGPVEQTSARLAARREEGQLEELGPAAGGGPEASVQIVSDSLFSWHSMQSGVQGRAFSRFLPISFWQVWQLP